MKKIKFIQKIILILAALFLLNIFAVSTLSQQKNPFDKFIYFSLNIEDDKAEVLKIDVIQDNVFYSDFFEEADIEQEYTFVVESDSGVYEITIPYYQALIKFDPNIKSFTIKKHDNILYHSEINFCNNNGVCEPCREKNCNLVGNTVTCDDCRSGTNDGYCDLQDDGICDPDCNNQDPDCSECQKTITCLTPQTECEILYEGLVCIEGETCIGNQISIRETDCCLDNCEFERINTVYSEGFEDIETVKEAKAEEQKIKQAEKSFVEKQEKQQEIYETTKKGIDFRVNSSLIIIFSLFIIIIITVFIMYFRLQSEAKLVQIEKEIQSLVNQRVYTQYAQIKQILLRKGYKEKDIDRAIKDHYKRYKT